MKQSHMGWFLAGMAFVSSVALAARQERPWTPPALPGGQPSLTVSGAELIRPPEGVTLREGVVIAKTPPVVDFLFFPGQDHPGAPWSNWGDGCVANGKYYTAIGDHLSPKGSARVFEYDPAAKRLRLLVDVREFLEQSGTLAPDENYIPAKIHCHLAMGQDGWLYYSTHRGSPRTTDDAHGYRGDHLFRTLPHPDPKRVRTEIVAKYPVPKHSLPAGILDPQRMIWYAGSAAGTDAALKGIVFLAYDCRRKKILQRVEGIGFDRNAILSRSTGCLYWRSRRGPEGAEPGQGLKYDPKTNRITECPNVPHVRSCTEETSQGLVYGTSERDCTIWAFHIKTEQCSTIGEGAVGTCTYTTTMEIDPSERYLYYVPGAHGGGPRDGTPVIQFDLKTKTRKVIAFLNALAPKVGAQFEGTFSTALSPDGGTLYITWNMGRPKWDCCGLTAVHIPASERQP